MKTGYARPCLSVLISALFMLPAVAAVAAEHHGAHATAVHSALPKVGDAKSILNTTLRHREWVAVEAGARSIPVWAVYPERSDAAPVAILLERNGPSDWVRAISDQLAAEGYIALAPTIDSESESQDAAAVREYAAALHAANGQVITLTLDTARTEVTASGRGVQANRFQLADSAWPALIAFLNRTTGNQPRIHVPADDHSAHFASLFAMAQVQLAGVPATRGRSDNGVVPASRKRPDLPASILTASSALAQTDLRHEWVEIPTSTTTLRTWVSYPAGDAKAGVVLVMQQGPGNDVWGRALADQLAREGFIAVAPDLHSGLGPNGGGYDDFKFLDDVMRANAKLPEDVRINLYKAAYEWATKLPRANGKTASIGFCVGGTNSFRFAAEVPELDAAVVYYGNSPNEAVIAKINAPVLGFYGEDDVRVTASVEPAAAVMKQLGKSFESHVYPQTTHAFLWYQEIARNYEATTQAWPRTLSFLRQHLN